MNLTGTHHVIPSILYLNTILGERTHEMTLAGIRRYAVARGWEVVNVPRRGLGPKRLESLLETHRPVAGCVVECLNESMRLPPGLFGSVPVVYVHPSPELRDGRVSYVTTDNEAVARAAFRELSVGRPAAFAVVEKNWKVDWSDVRTRTFQSLAAGAGMPCFVFPVRKEGREKRSARLAAWVGALPNRCAVFAVNDAVAAETADAARRIGRQIPRELTLLGVNNLPTVCEASHPSITSIQLDHERTGFLAARLLVTGGVASIGPLMAVRRESTGGRGRHEKFVLQAVEMIRREACEGLTAASLAARFRCSRWLFEKRFREATGYSVLDEILHVRMERVLSLLSQTDTAIGAIHALCGFRTGRALDSLFHARFKTSMREWRRRNGRVRQ